MINVELIKRVKTGSIKNVLLFGDSFDRQNPPYIVVKPIAGGDRKLFQIIVHVVIGKQEVLENYVLGELPELLKKPLTDGENKISIRSTGGWLGPYVDEGDNTLAMSRDYFVPIIL